MEHETIFDDPMTQPYAPELAREAGVFAAVDGTVHGWRGRVLAVGIEDQAQLSSTPSPAPGSPSARASAWAGRSRAWPRSSRAPALRC